MERNNYRKHAKELLCSTFDEMVFEISWNKITVKDICDRAGVSRKTFYYHFSSIVEVLDYKILQFCKMAEDYASNDDAEFASCFIDLFTQVFGIAKRCTASKKTPPFAEDCIYVLHLFCKPIAAWLSNHSALDKTRVCILINGFTLSFAEKMICGFSKFDLDDDKQKFVETYVMMAKACRELLA